MQGFLAELLILNSVMHLHSLFSTFLMSFVPLNYSQFCVIQRRKHLSCKYWSYSGLYSFSNAFSANVRDYLGILQLKKK